MQINKSYYTRLSEYVIVSPEWKNRWARIISGVLSPLTIAIAAVVIAAYGLNDESALTWIALYIALTVLPPTLYIIYLVRKGIVSDFHLNIREERTQPLILMTANTLLAFMVMFLIGAPTLILVVIAVAIIQLLCILLITFKWKISGHSTAIAGLVVLAVALFGESWLPLVLLIPLVAWSRIRLKRHTLAQTIAGAFLGIFTVTVLLYFTNFL
ncbi:MAG: hypothetical protein AAF462_07385 [Thermodesulfobacteriota bacterium]